VKLQSKKRREVPPGKKLIFRQSRFDPRLGRVVYAAPGRPFPILVDDVPVRQPRPVTLVPVRRPVPLKPPVRQPRPVTFVPVRRPQPAAGAHSEAHDVLGALAGGARAIRRAPAGQSASSNFAELLGGALAGVGATRASAAIGQAMPKQHADITTGLANSAMSNGEEAVRALRELAEEFRQRAEAQTGPEGDGLARFGYSALEFFMHLMAGAANGAPAGGLTHLALVNPTEENVQRLASNL
jgi:hypothetical protein